jgi:plasmid maintenance system antidote protein VapI
MAIRLGKAFGTRAESRLNQKAQYDLRVATQSLEDIEVEDLSAA